MIEQLKKLVERGKYKTLLEAVHDMDKWEQYATNEEYESDLSIAMKEEN